MVNNDLVQQLVQREMGAQQPAPPAPAPPQPVPSVPPSGGVTHTPPQAKRYATAQQMIDAYRNNWSPNPILLRAAMGDH